MDEDLLAMRKASRNITPSMCAACELEQEMTPEHREVFRKAFSTRGVNVTGIHWWVKERYPDARLFDLKESQQCLRRHRLRHLDDE